MNIQKIRENLIKEINALKDKRGFIRAGLPRLDRLFGRDSLIVSWQLLDFEPEICRKTLEILSKLQGKKIDRFHEEEPGKIIHETDTKPHPEKPKLPFPYYGSVDSTPLYLILFGFYFKKTKDTKFLKRYWRNILKAINWIEKYGDLNGDGFLDYEKKNSFGNFHHGWKDDYGNHLKIKPPVAIIEVQGYKYLALEEMARFAKIFGDIVFAKKLEMKAENLKENFNKKFWMKDKKFFALALDGKKRQKKAITSNPGQLLFTGIVDKEKICFIVKRLFKNDMWTRYGIRTHAESEPDFDPRSYHLGSIWPHDNWIIAQGLKKLGYQKEYFKIKTAILAAYKEIGFIPEFYGVINNRITLKMKKTVCHPQAWATGALLNFILTG